MDGRMIGGEIKEVMGTKIVKVIEPMTKTLAIALIEMSRGRLYRNQNPQDNLQLPHHSHGWLT